MRYSLAQVAAATSGDCGTAALAASSGVVINQLINGLEGSNASTLTQTEKEARRNLLTTLVTGITAAAGGNAAVANAAVTIETENNALFVKGTTARIQVAGIMVANVLSKPQGTLTRQELIASLNNLAKYYDAKDLTLQETINLNSFWLALLSNNPNLLTPEEVLNTKQFVQIAITSMAVSGGGNTSVRSVSSLAKLPTTDSEFVAPATNSTGIVTSSVQATRLNMQLSAEQAAGIRAPASITSYSNHANGRIAGRDGGIGVNQVAVDDAFANPIAIQYAPSTFGPTFKYVGKNATVVVNPHGIVVTTWGTSAAGVGK